MSTEVRFRRGTTAQHAGFTGASAEITVDTDKKVAVVHDGATAGGFPLTRDDQVPVTASTKAAATALSPRAGADWLWTAGFSTVGDAGGGLFKEAASEPSHAGKLQTLDARWWELVSKYPTVQQFGAKGDNVTDDTAAIQAALTFSRVIVVPPGFYKVTGTLIGQPNQIIIGLTPELCRFTRDTAYGTTLRVGATDGSDNAGAVKVIGLWFHHIYAFNNGGTYVPGTSTNITNKDPSSAHIQINYGQNIEIARCWFYGVGYGIEFLNTTIMWVTDCLFNGMWDANVAGLQDSTAGLWCHTATSSGRCGILYMRGCHVGGYAAAAATNVTTGATTVSKTLNAGMRYGVYLQSCEAFWITGGNYFGGQSVHCIYISATAIVGHGVISGNMIDGAAEYSILMESQHASYYANEMVIANNTGVGYGIDKGFLFIRDAGVSSIAAANVVVSGNTVQYYYRSGIRLEHVKGIKLLGNTVRAINSDADTTGDPYAESGCVLDGDCEYARAIGNDWGGGINQPSGGSANWGIYFSSATNNTASLESAILRAGATGTVVGGLSQTYPT